MAPELKLMIIDLIAERGLRPGDQLPTEVDLAHHFGLSRSTVREALKLLEQDGFANAVQGRGRFLAPLSSLKIERPITIYESITELLERIGFTVTNVVLSVEEEKADEHISAALSIRPGDPVIRLVRLRLGDDRPMVVSVNVLNRDVLPGPLGFRDWGGSITSALRGHGHEITSSVARITAANLPAKFAKAHNLEGLDPWLLVEETCVTRTGLHVLYALDYHQSSEIAFNVLRRR